MEVLKKRKILIQHYVIQQRLMNFIKKFVYNSCLVTHILLMKFCTGDRIKSRKPWFFIIPERKLKRSISFNFEMFQILFDIYFDSYIWRVGKLLGNMLGKTATLLFLLIFVIKSLLTTLSPFVQKIHNGESVRTGSTVLTKHQESSKCLATLKRAQVLVGEITTK